MEHVGNYLLDAGQTRALLNFGGLMRMYWAIVLKVNNQCLLTIVMNIHNYLAAVSIDMGGSDAVALGARA